MFSNNNAPLNYINCQYWINLKAIRTIKFDVFWIWMVVLIIFLSNLITFFLFSVKRVSTRGYEKNIFKQKLIFKNKNYLSNEIVKFKLFEKILMLLDEKYQICIVGYLKFQKEKNRFFRIFWDLDLIEKKDLFSTTNFMLNFFDMFVRVTMVSEAD